MKIMKVLDKKIGNTTYYKYRINLPKEIVEDLDLTDKELKIKKEGGKIIIEKSMEYKPRFEFTEKEKILQKEFASLIKTRKNRNSHN